IRLLQNGVSTTIVWNNDALPFGHNEWAWSELYVNGTTIEGRYWKEGTSRPEVAPLSVVNSALGASDGEMAISMYGRATLNGDIAQLVFIPLGGDV
ncbi:MAG TPA: hypothetical protein PLZ58_04605, partial [Candidatus Saccharibacteria bacterium]|nr:hypothetical protein [Candidatus Saccharibacteria bacterium]